MEIKKIFVPLIMLSILVILCICIAINKDNIKINNSDYYGTWKKITNNYFNDDLYSKTIIKYKIEDGKYTYTTITKYENGRKDYVLTSTGKYKKEKNKLILGDTRLYLTNNKVCINNKKCNNPLSKDEELIYDRKFDNYKFEDYINNLKYIENKNTNIYVFEQIPCNECYDYRNRLEDLVKDYNIKINIVNLNKVNKSYKEFLINEYKINHTPTTIIMKDNKILNTYTGIKKINEIEYRLDELGFKQR